MATKDFIVDAVVTHIVTVIMGVQRVTPPSQVDFVVLRAEEEYFSTETKVGQVKLGQPVRASICRTSHEARLLEG